jgi:hypothetical protein
MYHILSIGSAAVAASVTSREVQMSVQSLYRSRGDKKAPENASLLNLNFSPEAIA